MGRYMITARSTMERLKGVLAVGGTARRASIDAVFAGVGGSVEPAYCTSGSDDPITVCDVPSNEAVAALALSVGASGGASERTTVLATAAQVNAAVQQSSTSRAPGA